MADAEEMDLGGEGEEFENEVINTVEKLVLGCEKYVVQTVKAHKEEVMEASKKAGNEIKAKFESIESKLTNSEEDINSLREEIKRAENDARERQEKLHERMAGFEAATDLKISELSQRITELEGCKCKCKDFYDLIVSAGNIVFGENEQYRAVLLNDSGVLNNNCTTVSANDPTDLNCMDSSELVPNDSANFPVEGNSDSVVRSEAGLGTPDVAAEVVISNANPVDSRLAENSKRFSIFETQPQRAKVFTDLNELIEHLRKELTKYFCKNPLASKDKLSDLQRAYFKYYLSKYKSVGSKQSNHERALDLYEKGVADGIWSRNFSPSSNSKNFVTYLKQRFKNENMAVRMAKLKKLGNSQCERLLDKCCEDD